jgi:hypothetical protein
MNLFKKVIDKLSTWIVNKFGDEKDWDDFCEEILNVNDGNRFRRPLYDWMTTEGKKILLDRGFVHALNASSAYLDKLFEEKKIETK